MQHRLYKGLFLLLLNERLQVLRTKIFESFGYLLQLQFVVVVGFCFDTFQKEQC